MVLSGSKRTTYRSSMVNVNQGGGSKKAGLPPVIGQTSAIHNMYVESGNGIFNLQKLRINRFSPAKQNMPLGFRGNIRMR